MRRALWFGVAAWAVCFGAPAAAQSDGASLEAVQARLTREVQRILDESTIPSISLALVRGDEIVWAEAFGYANVRTQTQATTETLYSTGSTFKFVTATALMQLAEEGKLSFDDPVNRYLGDLAIEGADSVTFRHILSHHSGLRGPVNIVPLWERRAPMSLEDLVAEIEVIGPPGEEFRYCNECYALAGLLVSRISGEDYDAYVNEHILEPLGVTNREASVPTPAMVELLALPYALGDTRASPIAQVRYDVYPAGDMYLTPSDMARFLGAQLNEGVFGGNRILSGESVRAMREAPFEPNANYAYGTGSFEDDAGHAMIQHSGGIPGFNSRSIGDVDARVGAYLMANAGGTAGPLGYLGGLAVRLLRGEEVAERVAVEVPRDVLDRYVGRYEIRPEFVLTITRRGDRSYAQATGQQAFRLLAESETEFFFMMLDAQLTFEMGADGAVSGVVLHQGGRDRPAPKMP